MTDTTELIGHGQHRLGDLGATRPAAGAVASTGVAVGLGLAHLRTAGAALAGVAVRASRQDSPQLGVVGDAVGDEELQGVAERLPNLTRLVAGFVVDETPESVLAVLGVVVGVQDEGVPADVDQLRWADGSVGADAGVQEHQRLVDDVVGQLMREVVLTHDASDHTLTQLWVDWVGLHLDSPFCCCVEPDFDSMPRIINA